MPRGKKELAILKLQVLKSSWGEARPLPMAVKKIGVTERLTRSSRPRCYFKRWRQHTNTIRPHSALGYRPPAPPGDSSGSMTSVGSAAGATHYAFDIP